VLCTCSLAVLSLSLLINEQLRISDDVDDRDVCDLEVRIGRCDIRRALSLRATTIISFNPQHVESKLRTISLNRGLRDFTDRRSAGCQLQFSAACRNIFNLSHRIVPLCRGKLPDRAGCSLRLPGIDNSSYLMTYLPLTVGRLWLAPSTPTL